MNRLAFWSLPIVLVAALAACGGGGSGSVPSAPSSGSTSLVTSSPTVTPTGSSPSTAPSGGPSSTPSTAPSTSPSTTPTVTPTSAPSSSSTTYTGTVTAVQVSGQSTIIGGAVIAVGTGWTYSASAGGYVIANVLASATSGANGAFTINVPSNATVVSICVPGVNIFACIHRPIYTTANSYGVAPPANTFGTATLASLSVDETAGLQAINADRAAHGVNLGALPLSMDSDMVLAARATTANEAANDYYSHTQPGTNYDWGVHYTCTALTGAYCANPVYQQENLGAGATQTTVGAEASNIALGASDVHYQNVVSQTALFVGVGEYLNGPRLPTDPAGISQENFDAQEFLTTTPNPQP